MTEDDVLLQQLDSHRAALESGSSARPLRPGTSKDQAGPTMVFARLAGESPWSEGATEHTAAQWRELLLLGGIEAQLYAVGPGQVMVALQQGWKVQSVIEFLAQQHSVAGIEWAGHSMTRAEAADMLEDAEWAEIRARSRRKKRRRKTRRARQ